IGISLVERVALPQAAPLALLQIAGTPRRIQVVQRDQSPLDVRTGAHLGGGTQENTHLPAVHLVEELGFLQVGLGVVDEPHLVGRDAMLDQLGLDVVVDTKGPEPASISSIETSSSCPSSAVSSSAGSAAARSTLPPFLGVERSQKINCVPLRLSQSRWMAKTRSMHALILLSA